MCKDHECIRDDLDRYLSERDKKKDKAKLGQEEWLVLFLEYCRDEGKVPPHKTTYQGHNIGKWYSHQKTKITDTGSEMYIKLCKGHECIRQDLDRYISERDKKKDKAKLGPEEWLVLFLEYCRDEGTVPPAKTSYQGQNIGSWYSNQKKKITDTGSEMYIKLCKDHECIRDDLDRLLSQRDKKNKKLTI